MMGIGPFKAGDPRTWPDQAFTTDSGTFELTGVQNSAIALHIEDINNSNALYVCTGGWVIRDADNGKADFTPSPDDLLPTSPLGHAGIYLAYPVVMLASGPVAMDAQTLVVVALP